MRALAPTLALLALFVAVEGNAQTRKTEKPGVETSAPQSDSVPLSVIDWLGQPSVIRPETIAVAPPKTNEPPVAKGVVVPVVTIRPIGSEAPRSIGLVPTAVTGLPADIWAGSDGSDMARRIAALDAPVLPAAQALLYTVLLAEAKTPLGGDAAQDELALARVAKLVELGALDPASALIEQIGPRRSPEHFALWMDISLLLGTEDVACAALKLAPYLSAEYDRRIFCATRSGDFENAALTFGSAQALKLLDDSNLALLDRFLNPDLFDGAPPLAVPRKIDPLDFRLFETIGESLPTQPLPRQFAVADLRDLAGWKSQLQAAERLTRAGALPDNRLLGLYTDREPAASGGIWDRVEALQRFETALRTRSPDAISKTLPAVWRAMKEAELEVSFASLFADDLADVALTGGAARIAFEVRLLSPAYEAAAMAMGDVQHPMRDTLLALARGEAPENVDSAPVAQAASAAFSAPTPHETLIEMARARQLGAAILETVTLLEDGAAGDMSSFSDALSTLRALGLEDTARRAALQAILLDRSR